MCLIRFDRKFQDKNLEIVDVNPEFLRADLN